MLSFVVFHIFFKVVPFLIVSINFQEEQNRRIVQDQKKREEQLKIAAVKRNLKTIKEQKRLAEKSIGDKYVF